MATNATTLAKSGKFGDLRRRLVFLLLALVVYRIGTHIPVPGIDPNQMAELFKTQGGGILNLFNMFSGGALRDEGSPALKCEHSRFCGELSQCFRRKSLKKRNLDYLFT